MTVAGTWDIVVKAATGAAKGTLVLEQDGAALSGRVLSPTGNAELKDGALEGTHLTVSGKVAGAMPMKVEIVADVDGDSLTGTMKVGFFGTADLVGTRQA